MKRDWDLVRAVLTKLEEMNSTNGVLNSNSVEGFSPEVVSYHMYLLNEAGLIEATCSKPISGAMHCMARRLTWEGHEFLDKIKADTVWNKTKDLIKDKGIDMSFDAIKYAAAAVLKSLFE